LGAFIDWNTSQTREDGAELVDGWLLDRRCGLFLLGRR
jgi:hypothetical protein